MTRPTFPADPVDLGRALLVPELKDNLLSVPALADAGFTISFNKSACFINGPGAELIAPRVGNSYILDIPVPQELSFIPI